MKHIITEEMLESFSNMIKSKDEGDVSLAAEVLKERDVDNTQSEANFNKLMKMIISNEILFPKKNQWVARAGNEILLLKTSRWGSGNATFYSEQACARALSVHLTKLIGSESKGLKKHIRLKTLITNTEEKYKLEYNKLEEKYIFPFKNALHKYKIKFTSPTTNKLEFYDPQFNSTEYINNCESRLGNQCPKELRPYMTALKMSFGSGKKLKEFLLKEKIIKIERL